MGGVVALCLLIAVAFWFRRRRKISNLAQLKDTESSYNTNQEATVASTNEIMQEMPDHCIPYEADSRARLELDSRSRGELIGQIPRSELDDASRNRTE